MANGLISALADEFNSKNGLHCHWKPLPQRKGDVVTKSNPHSEPIRNSFISILYFAYHLLPFSADNIC